MIRLMRYRAGLFAGLGLVLTMLAISIQATQAAGTDSTCREVRFEQNSFTVCTFDLTRTDVRLHWKDAHGEAYGSLGAFVDAEGRSKPPLLFAMNAGMYRADNSPVGLYVENGQQLVKANTASGPGNFHMKPNGVFYIDGDSADVQETGKFLKLHPKAEFATQSGPMLVIEGKLHPRFQANGPSLKIRNGVGIRDPHTVVFAISNEAVSFGDFARLYRDSLGCQNALFLDGSISSLYAPSVDRADGLWPAGPIVSARPRVQQH